jgi:hypothetical protein
VEVTKWNAGWRCGAILSALMLWIAATPLSLGAQALETHRRPVPSLASIRYAPLALGPARGESPLAPERAAIRTAVRRSRWREGAIVGALLFGAAGAYVGGGICGADDGAGGAASDGCTGEIIGGGLLGAVVGAVPGGVIGAQIRKGPAGG